MEALFYETPKKDKRIYSILFFIIVPFSLLVITHGDWLVVAYSLVCNFLIYINSLEKYVVTDQALVVERGYWKWATHVIEWRQITAVTSHKHGFRLDYVKPNGKRSFLNIKVKDWKKLQHRILQHLG